MIKPVDDVNEMEEVAAIAIPAEEELSVNTEEPTSLFFGPETPLRQAAKYGGRPYEERPQQKEMAGRIAQVLDNQSHLCVEAPTGVGKTFAYLVPAFHYALQTRKPVVVSTHTISLQEQIIEKDLPLLAKLMNEPIRYAIAKGRGNYVCMRRLYAAAAHENEFLPSENLKPQLVRIREWAETSNEGSRSTLDFRPQTDVWDAVCCEMGNCLLGRCRFFKECFFMQARRRLLKAHIIVSNPE
ncbi:MAG: DEAD/DEAH box helicase family protein [Lentisphaeria bacterium]